MWIRLWVLFPKISNCRIYIIISSSDLIKFKEIMKNFPNSLWIWPLFTIIPLNSWFNIKIGKFGFILTLDRVFSMTTRSRFVIQHLKLFPILHISLFVNLSYSAHHFCQESGGGFVGWQDELHQLAPLLNISLCTRFLWNMSHLLIWLRLRSEMSLFGHMQPSTIHSIAFHHLVLYYIANILRERF